jgi:hypothetical protein
VVERATRVRVLSEKLGSVPKREDLDPSTTGFFSCVLSAFLCVSLRSSFHLRPGNAD